jgi:cardiolipin synthase
VKGSDQPTSTQGPGADAAGELGAISAGPAALYDTDRVWTLPNVLSLLRLLGIPLMVWLILGPQADGLAVLVLALGGFTDWLDGHLARAWHQTSRLGQMLDPIADRLYILAVLISLGLRTVIPWWLVGILVAREVMIGLLVPALKTRGYSSLPVHFLGKAGTFSLLYAFPLVLLGAGEGELALVARVIGWAFALWGAGLYWWAGFLYLAQTVGLLRSMPRIPRHARPGSAGSGS